MNEHAMSDALDAIHDEAEKLLRFDLPPEAEEIVDLIMSIARYQLDVRTDVEIDEASPDIEEPDHDRPAE
jgi:hypothetical protein